MATAIRTDSRPFRHDGATDRSLLFLIFELFMGVCGLVCLILLLLWK